MDARQIAKLMSLHQGVVDAQAKFCNPGDIRLAAAAADELASAEVLYNVYISGHVADPDVFAELEVLHKAVTNAVQRHAAPITPADRSNGIFALVSAQTKFEKFVRALIVN